MKKIIFNIILTYILLATNLYSQIIEEINVSGNKRISKESILIFSKLKTGLEYDEMLINNSLKNLYDTNFFEEIDISFNDPQLFIDLVERPIIENIQINGIKQKSLLEFIENNIFLKERGSFNEFDLRNDLTKIQNILTSVGYYFSKINSRFDKNSELNSINLQINVNLGNKAKIKNINFFGNKFFKEKKLREIIASEEHKFWKFISKKVYLNKNLIELDKSLLNKFYKDRGFYNVAILDSYVELDKKNSNFDLIFNINAGEKFIFNNLKLSLPDDYLDSDFKEIFKTFERNSGENYSLEFIDEIILEIESIASSRSYDFIDVKVEEKIIENNKLDFNFIVQDSKKYYVEKINIYGNDTTLEEVIRNKFIVDEGDPLNNLLFEKSINNIKSLGFFKNVSANIDNGSEQNLKVITINVEEQPTGEISLAAGVGTNGLATGGSLKEKNFLGQGIALDTSIELTEETLKGQFVYSKPNFAYTDNTLFTSFRSVNNDFLSLYGYETDEIGVSVGTSFEQYDNFFISPEIDFTLEELNTNDSASANIKKQEGDYMDLYFNYGLKYDQRNSSFQPSNGQLYNFSQQIPLISDNNEISNTFILSKYVNLNKSSEMIGRAGLYLKSINTIDGSDVRISKRAVIPYNRLRGFEKGKVGPVDNNDYVGGNYVSTLNLSTNLPNILSSVENIDFNYFIDFANVWGVDYNSSLDNSKIRSSTGIGLNLLTPIGPLSFSLSQPITKASSDKTETFRFNLGTTF
jgi:outer membrane protein insertion porin family